MLTLGTFLFDEPPLCLILLLVQFCAVHTRPRVVFVPRSAFTVLTSSLTRCISGLTLQKIVKSVMIAFTNIITFSAVAFALGSFASPHDVPHRRHAELHAQGAAVNSTHTLTKRFDGARFTWFYPGLGACGGYNGDGDFVRPVI